MTKPSADNQSGQPLGLPLNDQLGAWQPIETAPMTGRKVILFYLNRNNKARTVMARWLTDEQAAETDADGVGLEGGWYECIDNWDDYTEVAIHEGEPSHWMPLPAAPAVGSPLDCGVGRLVPERDQEGPRGTYGCACVADSAHACAEIRYGYRDLPEPCECLCHDWRDDYDDLG